MWRDYNAQPRAVTLTVTDTKNRRHRAQRTRLDVVPLDLDRDVAMLRDVVSALYARQSALPSTAQNVSHANHAQLKRK